MTKEFNKVFSENLKRYLAINQLTQERLAKLLGVSPSSVTGWVKGEQSPRMDKVDLMCEIFGCSRSDLMQTKNERDAQREEIINRLYKGYGALMAAVEGLKPSDAEIIIAMAKRMKEDYRD